MSKRLLAMLLSLVMILGLIPTSIAFALPNSTATLTMKADRTEANPGDEINFSVELQQTGKINTLEATISLPEGLTLVPGSLSTINRSELGWDDFGMNESALLFSGFGSVSYEGTNPIVVATFKCTVNADAIGKYTVSLIDYVADDENYETKNPTAVGKEINVVVPVTGVTLDKDTLALDTGDNNTATLVAAVDPNKATNKAVTWDSSDKTVATVENGVVTAIKHGTTTITVKTVDGGFTDVCVVTVTCAHTSKTQITEKASTCTKKGWDTYSQCDICGQLFDETDNEIDEIPYRALIAHTQSKPVREKEIAATCETAGSYDEVVYCTVCHTEISREMKTILPLEHDWNEGTVTTPATCTTDGVKTFTCKHDASHTYTKVIPAAGHSPAEAVKENEVAATCETAGSYEEVVYCSVCHAELSRETINILAAGHDWDKGKVTMAATCTTDGVRTYTCKHDASHTYTEAISAIGHTPTEAAIENEISATCSFTGSYDEVVYCSVCHEEVSRVTKTIPIDEDAHDWGEWVQTKAPTATESGEEIRICEHNPSHYETRKIPPIGSNETEYSFLDDEVIIVAPSGAIPEESTFDVQKIVPPPQEIVEKVKNQFGNSSSVLAYYEVRLTTGDGTPIIKLNGEITIKVKIPQEYLGSKSVQLLQEDENGKLVVMTSWWENDYLCYKTDWLEIY